MGARARNAAEAASSQQDGAQQQSAPAAKPAQRRKPSSSSKSRRKSQAAGGEEEVEDGSEAEGGTQHWQAIKRQRRAPAPARKPPLAGGVVGGLPQLPLVPSLPLPPAAVALPMGAFVQPAALLDAQQLQAQMQIMRAQFEQNEIFAHVVAQTRPVQQPLLPVAPAAQQAGAGGGKQGEGGAGQAGEQEEREADTDEEDVAELLGLLRHRSPACPSSLAAPPSATQAAATAAVAAASAAEQRREEAQQAAAKEEAAAEAGVQLQEGEAVKQGERQQPADKQEQQPGVAGEPQAAAPGEQPAEAAAAAVKAEAQPAAKQEAQPAVSGPQAEQQPQAQQPLAKQQQLKEEEEHAASDGGADDMALDPTLAPSTAPIDDPHLETLCLSQPVSLAGCGTEPCSPTAASQPPDPAEWQARQQPAGSQAGEGQGSHQVGAAHAAGQQQEAQQHAAWGDQGSQPDTAPGSLSPQMAAVKSSAAQLSLGRAIEAFQAADIDSSMSMLLPLRRLQRAGKGGAALQVGCAGAEQGWLLLLLLQLLVRVCTTGRALGGLRTALDCSLHC